MASPQHPPRAGRRSGPVPDRGLQDDPLDLSVRAQPLPVPDRGVQDDPLDLSVRAQPLDLSLPDRKRAIDSGSAAGHGLPVKRRHTALPVEVSKFFLPLMLNIITRLFQKSPFAGGGPLYYQYRYSKRRYNKASRG